MKLTLAILMTVAVLIGMGLLIRDGIVDARAADKRLQPEVQVSSSIYRVRDPETGVTCYMSTWQGTSCLVTPADQIAASQQAIDGFLKK